jgi:hypothetical protein
VAWGKQQRLCVCARAGSKLSPLVVSYVAFTFLPFFTVDYYFMEWIVGEFELLAVPA